MKKKALLFGTAIALVAALAVGGTLAYLQDKTDTATNTFALGDVEGELLENGDDSEPDFIDWEGGEGEPADIIPGQSVQKAPRITNTGNNPAYVRLTVEISENWIVEYNLGTGDSQWTLGDDGKYYYNSVLAVEGDAATTAPLFTEVTLSGEVTEDVTNESLNIVVYGELIQSDYLSGDPANAEDAFVLFTDPTAGGEPGEEPEE
ncbi:MAG: SipW-dependent-type signal peptide-containing protein [Clostridiales Family XIII bacterium]|nr:SipW-dependent-type signal peptide-containing protein [Clostridiales Family XIII bacterium]